MGHVDEALSRDRCVIALYGIHHDQPLEAVQLPLAECRQPLSKVVQLIDACAGAQKLGQIAELAAQDFDRIVILVCCMTIAGDLSINTDCHQVFRDGSVIELTQREYELLTFLASHPNKVYARIDLMEQVWNYGYVGDDARTVDVTVRRLREKIEADPANPRYILTRRGAGYYFST